MVKNKELRRPQKPATDPLQIRYVMLGANVTYRSFEDIPSIPTPQSPLFPLLVVCTSPEQANRFKRLDAYFQLLVGFRNDEIMPQLRRLRSESSAYAVLHQRGTYYSVVECSYPPRGQKMRLIWTHWADAWPHLNPAKDRDFCGAKTMMECVGNIVTRLVGHELVAATDAADLADFMQSLALEVGQPSEDTRAPGRAHGARSEERQGSSQNRASTDLSSVDMRVASSRTQHARAQAQGAANAAPSTTSRSHSAQHARAPHQGAANAAPLSQQTPAPNPPSRSYSAHASSTGGVRPGSSQDVRTARPATVALSPVRNSRGEVVGTVIVNARDHSAPLMVHSLGAVVDRFVDSSGYPADFVERLYHFRAAATSFEDFQTCLGGSFTITEAYWLWETIEYPAAVELRERDTVVEVRIH